jgi:coproporphyrinogen III oxidase-like Fe-S oxidoreductase
MMKALHEFSLLIIAQHALSYGTTHLSLYNLTIEPGTAYVTDFSIESEDIFIHRSLK